MIHPTAIIDPSAILHSGVKVGAYSFIGPDVEIGVDCEILHHVVINGPTKIGKECRVFSFATIGTEPQDKKFHGERTYLEIGNNNIIREYVNISRGTENGGGITRIGDRGLIMSSCHIAHDCLIGNDVIISGGSFLSGHVEIRDHVNLGGMTSVVQFCRVGEYAYTGGVTTIRMDVAPFSVIIPSDSVTVTGINFIGLERKGFTPEEIDILSQAFETFFRSGLARKDALEKLSSDFPGSKHVKMIVDFMQQGEKGVYRPPVSLQNSNRETKKV